MINSTVWGYVIVYCHENNSLASYKKKNKYKAVYDVKMSKFTLK